MRPWPGSVRDQTEPPRPREKGRALDGDLTANLHFFLPAFLFLGGRATPFPPPSYRTSRRARWEDGDRDSLTAAILSSAAALVPWWFRVQTRECETFMGTCMHASAGVLDGVTCFGAGPDPSSRTPVGAAWPDLRVSVRRAVPPVQFAVV
jgi:hypothetical protein